MQKSCKDIEQMLVDYADGRLSPSDSTQVAEHLAECERCRSTVKGLKKSLELADVIWQDHLTEAKATRAPIPRKSTELRRAKYAAVAAIILIVLGGSIVWRAVVRPAEKELTFPAIQRKISESASAARLLAAADLLAKYTDTKDIAKRQYHYVVKKYPDTPAAAEAKLRIQ